MKNSSKSPNAIKNANQKKINSENIKKNSEDQIQKEKENPINKINLSKFVDQLKGIELKEKKDKETIYIYPEGFTKEMIGSDKGKKFRNSLRNAMKKFANNIMIFAKIADMDKLSKEIESFQSFYKKNYRITDYSLKSLSASSDPLKERDLTLMLDIVKECLHPAK